MTTAVFKSKPSKTRYTQQRKTIEDSHKKKALKFDKDKKSLEQKKKKLVKLDKNLNRVESMNMGNFSFDDIKNRTTLKTNIEKLKNEINNIENNTDESEYYYKVGDILVDYYDELDDGDYIVPISNVNELVSTDSILNGKGKDEFNDAGVFDILEKLNNAGRENVKITQKRKRRRKSINRPNIKVLLGCEDESSYDFEDETINIDKAKLSNNYVMLVDNEYVNSKTLFKKCTTYGCDGEKVVILCEGVCVCESCGDTEMIVVESEKPNYKDPVPDKPGYPYKRINHLNEWLSQFQAKESIDISKEIYDNILNELYKNKFYDLEKLDIKFMRKILKSLGLTTYYEHSVYIICKLSGKSPPTISRQSEEKIRYMFRQIQEPFDKYKPQSRYNFLSYSFVLHKFFELLELDEYLHYFPLLKSREKLRYHDFIWKKICADLRWEFIPSV